MISRLPTTHEDFGMGNRMVFPIPFQGLIDSERIRIVDGPFAGLSLDMQNESCQLQPNLARSTRGAGNLSQINGL